MATISPQTSRSDTTSSDPSTLGKKSLAYLSELSPRTTSDTVGAVRTINARHPNRRGETPNKHKVNAWQAYATMTKTQIGIGALSIPQAFNKIGLIPGIICLQAVAAIALFASYQIARVKARHPHIRSIGDLGAHLCGRSGRIVFSTAYDIYFTFVAASAMQTISVCFNAITNHATCTQVFFTVAAVIVCALSSFKSLAQISYFYIFGVLCILTSLFTVTIGASLQERPPAAIQTGPWTSDYKLVGDPSFFDFISACSTFFFAFSGIMAFFTVHEEMAQPEHYNRAVTACILTIDLTYTITSSVIYFACGSYVSSPALGSAGGTIKIVCYALALPGLLASGCLVSNITAKDMHAHYTAWQQGPDLLPRNNSTDSTLAQAEALGFPPGATQQQATKRQERNSNIAWYVCTISVSFFAFIIASVIPNFDLLIEFIGALLGTFMLFIPMAWYWIHENFRIEGRRNVRHWLMIAACILLMAAGIMFLAAGTLIAGIGIHKAQHSGSGQRPFTCMDNSGTVMNVAA